MSVNRTRGVSGSIFEQCVLNCFLYFCAVVEQKNQNPPTDALPWCDVVCCHKHAQPRQPVSINGWAESVLVWNSERGCSSTPRLTKRGLVVWTFLQPLFFLFFLVSFGHFPRLPFRVRTLASRATFYRVACTTPLQLVPNEAPPAQCVIIFSHQVCWFLSLWIESDFRKAPYPISFCC